MIRINLLPKEKRKPESPPMLFFALAGGATVIVAVLLIYLAFALMGLASTRSKEQDLKKQVDSLKPYEAEHDDLVKKLDKIKARKKAVEEISATRTVLWSRVVDELFDVVSDSPTIWLTSLKGSEGGAQAKVGGTGPRTVTEREMTFEVFSATEEYGRITEFRNLLSAKLLSERLLGPKNQKMALFNVMAKIQKIARVPQKDYVPGWALKATIELKSQKQMAAPTTAKTPPPQKPK
ncbi:MAG: hypothetical protein RDV41_09530 [Planctomycetota bacterium]|nr:hypothetical protein [Planctomycetota bacterium]